MKYIITPLNEGQEMNCHVKADGSKSAVIKRAISIAATLQTALAGNNITCRVRHAGRGWEITDEEGPSIIATAAGQMTDELSGTALSRRAPLPSSAP
jgi:hypothetical protein